MPNKIKYYSFKNGGNTETLNFGNDAGFSSLKGSFVDKEGNTEHVHIPSMYMYRPDSDRKKNQIDVGDPRQKNSLNSLINNDFNRMYVKISSPSIPNPDQAYYVGHMALINSGTGYSHSDIYNSTKSTAILTRVQTYTTIAYKAVNDYYKINKKLPKAITAYVYMATALPETEASDTDNSKKYIKSLKNNGNSHVVHLLNFKEDGRTKDVSVSIYFKQVGVGVESEIGSKYGLDPNDEKGVGKAIQDDFKSQIHAHYTTLYKYLSNPKNGISLNDYVKDIANSYNVDIGEVTTDCVGLQDNKFSPNHSTSFTAGCYNYLEETRKSLINNYQFGKGIRVQDIRHDIKKSHNKKAHIKPLDKATINVENNVLNRSMNTFVEDLNDDIGNAFSSIGATFDRVLVFGGGSKALYKNPKNAQALRNVIANFAGKQRAPYIPVLFVKPEYAQQLNMYGLESMVKAIFVNNEH